MLYKNKASCSCQDYAYNSRDKLQLTIWKGKRGFGSERKKAPLKKNQQVLLYIE